jgi:D-sedoheptulose 7-phosphate isomerase
MLNQIDKLAREAATPAEFARGYFNYLKSVLDAVSPEAIDALVEEFEAARSAGTTIFVAGNGGSATTATSMANDLGFDVLKKTGTAVPFRLLALTDSNAVITASANDVGYERIFVNQLSIHWREGDRLLLISASGNSPNLVEAAKWMRSRKGRVISFLGFDGGELSHLSDLVVHVPTSKGEYGPVEDAHLVLNHVLAHWFQARLKSAPGATGA